jgi:alkylation response protein AidB-like acyl-CoA dehydrogenase
MSTRGPVLVSADARIDRLERARALVPTLAARAAGTAEDRRVPDATIADFRAAGLFRILQPARFGGSELDFTVFSGATRELARGCASSAWVYAVIEEIKGLGFTAGWTTPEALRQRMERELAAWGDMIREIGHQPQ